MKKILALIAVSFSYIGLSAQTVTINYTEGAIVSPEKLKEFPVAVQNAILEKNFYILTTSNNASEYRIDPASEKKRMIAPEIKTKVIMQENERYYYKDYAHNELVFEIGNGTDVFQGKDDLKKWTWKITNETKVIAGYKCKKATTEYLGNPITAWFTADLPKNAGPDRFDSLPGTILSIVMPKYEYTATSVKVAASNTSIDKPVFKDKTYTMAEMNYAISAKTAATRPGETSEKSGNGATYTKTVTYTY
ncbi:GLPGLI family protein [Flavobacterium psychrotrophum]|uniref:GLPGLI family protein n=1 Tax=Flavobacterium psychrotrophum TaxID=2294119 RepID=UPI000E30C5E5|nr:GLPGLI family protein [Flavobacterium psychrotrophum]